MDATATTPLKESLRGDVLDAHHPDYDAVRALFNGMIDKRPRLIARCVDVADVIASVTYAREAGLLVAIRGGGHNGPGLGSCDDGLMIDLSLMRSVRVDPKTATIRVEGGCTHGDIDHAAHPFGITVPTGIMSTTGIGGLCLGGGHGYLTRQYGLTIDSLLEADVVLADGRLVTASAEENEDLFWALRGGGGNFGVVISFLFQGHPASTVFGGPVFWDIAHAHTLLEWYPDFLPQAPVELNMFAGLKSIPSMDPFPLEIQGKRACALINCYNGNQADAAPVFKSMYDDLPPPMLDAMAEMPFPALQGLFDPILRKSVRMYWKGDYVWELTDEAIEVYVDHGSKSPTELSLIHFYPIDGAVHRVKPDATAWSCRDAQWSMVIAGIDYSPENDTALCDWGRAFWEAAHPFNPGGAYVNFMMDDEGSARVKASYGENYARLAKVKATYDPDNFFRVNQNIEPA